MSVHVELIRKISMKPDYLTRLEYLNTIPQSSACLGEGMGLCGICKLEPIPELPYAPWRPKGSSLMF